MAREAKKSLRRMTAHRAIKLAALFVFVGAAFSVAFFFGDSFFPSARNFFSFAYEGVLGAMSPATAAEAATSTIVAHISTPDVVKGIYMTSWVAGAPTLRERVAAIAETTEINSLVIDIKDYSGNIAFEIPDPYLQSVGATDRRVKDIADFIARLHKSGIYVIGRIAVFQDPEFVKKRPDLAVRRAGDGGIWHDYKGLTWIDPGAREAWEYVMVLARESYKLGFDEINFDYIRFPSDGNMKDIAYPHSGDHTKADVLRDFFEYLHDNLKPYGIPISADLFGMTTTNTDDLNIGQLLENAVPYFDSIDPMVYPSHYPFNFNGYGNPNSRPYDVVHFSLMSAVRRLTAASSTPAKIRPWLQDFDYGGNYDAAAVRTQIQATYDAGLTSWLLWDAANKYTLDALEKN
jgi:hypothetical protein